MTRFAIALFSMLLWSAAAFADADAMFNVISFSVSSQAEVPNDEIEIVLSVDKEARRAADLAAQINSDMQWALELARSNAEVRSQTREYRSQPRYDNTGAVVAWRGTQLLSLTSTDIEAATSLATALQEKLLIQSMNLHPTVATRERVQDELTVSALARFRERAQLIGRSMDAENYDVVELQIREGGRSPGPVYRARAPAAMEMSADVATEPGTSNLQVFVEGRIQLR